jgi:hypothetical protein
MSFLFHPCCCFGGAKKKKKKNGDKEKNCEKGPPVATMSDRRRAARESWANSAVRDYALMDQRSRGVYKQMCAGDRSAGAASLALNALSMTTATTSPLGSEAANQTASFVETYNNNINTALKFSAPLAAQHYNTWGCR